MTSKLRIAYLMVDGTRHRTDILTTTAGMGVTIDDLDRLIALGFIEAVAPASVAAPIAESRPADLSPEQQSVIFMAAAKQATALTATLGLRGFRLNLAVESAQNLQDLEALLPQMTESLGASAGAPLQRLLSHS